VSITPDLAADADRSRVREVRELLGPCRRRSERLWRWRTLKD